MIIKIGLPSGFGSKENPMIAHFKPNIYYIQSEYCAGVSVGDTFIVYCGINERQLAAITRVSRALDDIHSVAFQFSQLTEEEINALVAYEKLFL